VGVRIQCFDVGAFWFDVDFSCVFCDGRWDGCHGGCCCRCGCHGCGFFCDGALVCIVVVVDVLDRCAAVVVGIRVVVCFIWVCFVVDVGG